MSEKNLSEARNLIRRYRLFSYEIADALGIEPSNFSRWFRSEASMTDERLDAIKGAVEQIVKGEDNEH